MIQIDKLSINFLFFIISNYRRMEKTISSIVKTNTTLQLNQILYQSPLKYQNSDQSFIATVYDNCIMLDHGKCIQYQFDIKFITSQESITFEMLDQSISFILCKKDSEGWKNILKGFLNQRGFHQQYKAIKKIGKGCFAQVFMVEQVKTSQKFAVKTFSKQSTYSEDNGKECLMKQIEIMRKLTHKNNMHLHQVFETDNTVYMVFQLLQGGQLYNRIKSKTLFTHCQIKTMIKGLLEGLQQMHDKNIMHRDLKPENILFRSKEDYDCVIADFGLSEFTTSDKYLFVRCGTPGYVAPEVINIKDKKKRYSPICDIFSLGLIFHILVFGKSVFPGKKYEDVLAQNRACDFKLQGQPYQSCEVQMMDLMKKMLRIDPDERITTQQALSHPYFRDQQQTQQIAKKLIQLKIRKSSNMSQEQINKENKKISNDSCLSLHMGKKSVFTGQTDTINTLNHDFPSFNEYHKQNSHQKVSKFAKAQQ